jgi:hypothetical protein
MAHKLKLGLGKLQRNAYNFAKANEPKWHTYNTDSTTKRVMLSLKKRGLIETNKFNMFRYKK